MADNCSTIAVLEAMDDTTHRAGEFNCRNDPRRRTADRPRCHLSRIEQNQSAGMAKRSTGCVTPSAPHGEDRIDETCQQRPLLRKPRSARS
jgi:hypothetical protein